MEFNVSNYEDVLEYLPDNSKQIIKNNPYDITKNIVKEIHTYCKNKKTLTIVGPVKRKSLKLKLKILNNETQKKISVSPFSFFKISKAEKKQIKIMQRSAAAVGPRRHGRAPRGASPGRLVRHGVVVVVVVDRRRRVD